MKIWKFRRCKKKRSRQNTILGNNENNLAICLKWNFRCILFDFPVFWFFFHTWHFHAASCWQTKSSKLLFDRALEMGDAKIGSQKGRKVNRASRAHFSSFGVLFSRYLSFSFFFNSYDFSKVLPKIFWKFYKISAKMFQKFINCLIYFYKVFPSPPRISS